ncbi:hypothetical protein YC2023_009973 [Brassica napus]
MIDVSAKNHRFCNHLNTSLPSRDSWPPRHEFIILYFAFLWVMRESIRSYLHSTKTSTITSSSSTLCNDQSRFIQRRVMVGDDSLMSTRRPSVQSKLVSDVKLHRFHRRSHRSAGMTMRFKENRKKPGHFSARHGRIGKHRSQQLPVGWFMPAWKPLPKTSLASFRDSARFQARGWRERLLREPHGLLEQQDEPVLCFLCSARAASESSRSSYYSLHMEGSGKLELRWESNITFWKSLRLYRGKARVSSSPSRARSITTPSSPRRKQLQHLPEKRQSERELRGATETFDQRSERVEIVSNP